MLSITDKELYIKSITTVVKSYITEKHIGFCRPRESDGFIWIHSGSCSYTFESGRRFTANSGDILYLSHKAVYKMDVHERYEFTVVNFLFDSDEELLCNSFTPKDRTESENTFGKLMRRYRRQSDGYFADCMSLLYKIYSMTQKSVRSEYIQGSAKYKIEQARQALIQGFQSPTLTVASLAHDAGMSEVYFRKLFKARFGTTPTEYITSCRIEYAKELLKLDYLSLSDIADSCGFSSASYFCRVFKKHTGSTPRELFDENL